MRIRLFSVNLRLVKILPDLFKTKGYFKLVQDSFQSLDYSYTGLNPLKLLTCSGLFIKTFLKRLWKIFKTSLRHRMTPLSIRAFKNFSR